MNGQEVPEQLITVDPYEFAATNTAPDTVAVEVATTITKEGSKEEDPLDPNKDAASAADVETVASAAATAAEVIFFYLGS